MLKWKTTGVYTVSNTANNTRVCYKCRTTKALGDFARDASREGGFSYRCKTCANASRKALRDNIRDALQAIKLESGCVDCGYNDHPQALDFDHTEDNKVMNPSALRRYNLAAALVEASKCEVVCANCHRIRTYERSGKSY